MNATTASTTATTALIAAILATAADLAEIGIKTDKNNLHGGRYISARQMVSTISPAMARHGLLLIPGVIASEITPPQPGQAGAASAPATKNTPWIAVCQFHFRITNGQAEESIPWQAIGSDYTQPDAAVSKALTIAHRQVLAKLFSIVSDDDPAEDADSRQRKPAEQQQRRQPAPQAQPQPRPAASTPAAASANAPTPRPDAGPVYTLPIATTTAAALASAATTAADRLTLLTIAEAAFARSATPASELIATWTEANRPGGRPKANKLANLATSELAAFVDWMHATPNPAE